MISKLIVVVVVVIVVVGVVVVVVAPLCLFPRRNLKTFWSCGPVVARFVFFVFFLSRREAV